MSDIEDLRARVRHDALALVRAGYALDEIDAFAFDIARPKVGPLWAMDTDLKITKSLLDAKGPAPVGSIWCLLYGHEGQFITWIEVVIVDPNQTDMFEVRP